jgi:hypothetical protein
MIFIVIRLVKKNMELLAQSISIIRAASRKHLVFAWLCAIMIGVLTLASTRDVHAASVIVQLVNHSDRNVNMRLYSEGESKDVWPNRSRAYTFRPTGEVQQMTLTCTAGERICWGQAAIPEIQPGTAGRGAVRTGGVPSTQITRNRPAQCATCCFVCEDGKTAPVLEIGSPKNEGTASAPKPKATNDKEGAEPKVGEPSAPPSSPK